MRVARSSSMSSDEGSIHSSRPHAAAAGEPLPPPVLVYHESAHSIVFRDHLRRAAAESSSNDKPATTTTTTTSENTYSSVESVEDASDNSNHHTLQGSTHDDAAVARPPSPTVGFQPKIQPLPRMELGPGDIFAPLLQQSSEEADEDWNLAEREVVERLRTQRACVKTINNVDWNAFAQRFLTPLSHKQGRGCACHHDIPPQTDSSNGVDGGDATTSLYPFNSFVTSTTLLPSGGKKMRCYGSLQSFCVGAVFALPDAYPHGETESTAAERTRTWSWPAGYSAKTEFNIDSRGNLINGRREALVPLAVLREYNHDYLHATEYTVANRKVSGLNQIPYNEVFLRVGGPGRIVNGRDYATDQERTDENGTGRSFDKGVGGAIALFVRTASFGHLMSLLRTRSRLINVLGAEHYRNLPLLLIDPELGTRVLTEQLQLELWKLASSRLHPFQNPLLSRKTTINHMDEGSFKRAFVEKVDELIELDSSMREKLTNEELARIAGGFGATDESVAGVLKQVMLHDLANQKAESGESHMLQDIVNEGLTFAVRSGDFLTARQLLILYSVVAARGEELSESGGADDDSTSSSAQGKNRTLEQKHKASLGSNADQLVQDLDLQPKEQSLSATLTPIPPPPPLDTDRLRGATNSDGLLAVLGAAQILKAMQDGGSKKRCEEVADALEEWCNYGEQSVTFRISSWYDQRAAQGDLQIATDHDSRFMAFVSNKAISNRRNFAQHLREAVSRTDFTDVRFLQAIRELVNTMHSPCLRLELLQYVLGLDNRYSVLHVARSVELASTCLGVSSGVAISESL